MLRKLYAFHEYYRIALLLVLVAFGVLGCGSTSSETAITLVQKNTPTIASQNTTVKPIAAASASTATVPFDGWNAVAIAFANHPNTGQWAVVNSNYLKGHTIALTQYVIPQPQLDGIAPSGKELIYQIVNSGHVLYYTALSRVPNTGFFF